ncbi:MAG TPA: hypothetical protein VHQ65_01215 [Thermoanaerobaculia bacterium]|nr:hypothetical protein [Thermoanaerobaculia bacterium]
MDELRYITKPARSLEDFDEAFDPALIVDPESRFYAPRSEYKLRRLRERLAEYPRRPCHLFLCGHRGSGKTTELMRLERSPELQERYLTLFMTARRFGAETTYLTHDALMVEIGLSLAEEAERRGLGDEYRKEVEDWGRDVVRTFLHDQSAETAAGIGGSAWIAFFKGQLQSRREWKTEQRLLLEPKVQDLLAILNRTAAALREATGKQVLVFVDDLEKGESDAHQRMHTQLFDENYETLVQPRFSIVYTLPIYFRSRPGTRIPQDEMVTFSSLKIYHQRERQKPRPDPDPELDGYKVILSFVERRLEDGASLFEEGVLDELLLIGGGLFRETARALKEAAAMARYRGSRRIERQDAEAVFHYVKKEYQPMIRGEAVALLQQVLTPKLGWVPGVEPYLQSRAVVEYENDDLWLDLRYPLKEYVRSLQANG